MILWLIGMMGSGKTSAGRLAAERLKVGFSDTDAWVEERLMCSISFLWVAHGELALRETEKAAVRSLAEGEGLVATGGGVVLGGENRRIMAESGAVVWLEASLKTLAARLEGITDRPGLISGGPPDAFLEKTLAQRRELYAEAAAHRVSTDGRSIEQTAAEIEQIWRGL